MSATADRIVAGVLPKSLRYWQTAPPDHLSDDSLSFGDWKDAINIELHTLKKSLEELAQECDEGERWGTAAKLRALSKEL